MSPNFLPLCSEKIKPQQASIIRQWLQYGRKQIEEHILDASQMFAIAARSK